jgi:hemerythrin
MVAESENRASYVIEWRDAFKVDIPQLDEEHRHLFELVGALNLKSMDKTINELVDYVVTHFSNEQELMEKSEYPEFDAHLKLHEEFSLRVADFLGSGQAWTEDQIQQLRRFLNKWLVGHILTHDRRFSKWYIEHYGTADAPVVRAASHKRSLLARILGID